MKVLLDENVPCDFRYFLAGHEVMSTWHHAWSTSNSARLLERAATLGFDVLITSDPSLGGMTTPPGLAVFYIQPKVGSLEGFRPFVVPVLESLAAFRPRALVVLTPEDS